MEEPNSASETNEQKTEINEETELENDCLVAIGLNYEEDNSITLQFLTPPEEAREPSEEALSNPSSQSEPLEDLTLEALVQEELQQQQEEEEEEFTEPIEGVSELSTPLMTSPRELQESCSQQVEEIEKRNPLYSKEGQTANSTPSLSEVLSQQKTNEEMKQIVEEVLKQFEIDSFQHLEIFDGINSLFKKLKDDKQQLLRIHNQLSLNFNPVLESLPQMKVLNQQEQILKSKIHCFSHFEGFILEMVFAKEILSQIQEVSKNRVPLQSIKSVFLIFYFLNPVFRNLQEIEDQQCSFSKSKIPDWMLQNREFGQKILQRPLPLPLQKQDFENFVLEVDINKKSETGNCKVKWVKKQTIIDKLEAKKKQEQQKLEQKEKEEKAKLESKPKPQIPPKTQDLPKPVVKTEPISEVKTSAEEQPLGLSLDSLAIGSETKQESTGFFSTVKPLETPTPVPAEAPKSQPMGFFTPQNQPVLSTGPIEKPKEEPQEIMSAEPTTTGNLPFQGSGLFKNLGAFSNNQSNSSLTGVAAFGANSFPRPPVPSFGMNLVAPSLGSLGQPKQEGSMSNEGGFAGITGGFSILSRQTQDIQLNQTPASFGGGFSQFSQQSNAFQQSFQQQSQSNTSNSSSSSVFGVQPSPQNKGLWQMRK